MDGRKRYVNDDRLCVDGEKKNMRLLAFAFTIVFVWTGPKSSGFSMRAEIFMNLHRNLEEFTFKVDFHKFKAEFRRPLTPLLLFLELNSSISLENRQLKSNSNGLWGSTSDIGSTVSHFQREVRLVIFYRSQVIILPMEKVS